MKAAIIALGSELLGTTKLDHNSLRITEAFERFGVELVGKSTIGDNEHAIGDTLRYWITRADVIVTTGGLGPTTDDVTRSAVATALGKTLSLDQRLEEQLGRRFASMGRHMAAVNRRQAMMIEGGTTLDNAVGTAPGMRIEHEGTTMFLFPGVPREVDEMIGTHLIPWLHEQTSNNEHKAMISHAVLKVACLPESEVEQRILPAYEEFGRERITILGSPGEVVLDLTARGNDTDCNTMLRVMQDRLRELIGDAVFTDNAQWQLEHVVGTLLALRKQSLATAESCTGGLLAERLTRVSGSSAYFLGGVVTYSNDSKTDVLGIPKTAIDEHGAVSETVARAMARNVRSQYGSDYGIGITGVAGPSGGSATKPVGTVHITLIGHRDTDYEHHHKRFSGDRDRVRLQATQWALNMLRQALQNDNTMSH